MKNPRDQQPGAMDELSRLRWGVAANAGRLSSRRTWRWSHVRSATGLGSTKAQELCIAAGFDPDELVGGDDQQQPSPTAGTGARSCRQHEDCDAADVAYMAAFGQYAPHGSLVDQAIAAAPPPSTGPATCDAEVNALARIHGELLAFDDATRKRMLWWLGARLPTDPQSAPPPSTGEPAGRCADCGAALNKGEAETFTVCDACWDRAYPKPAAPTGELDADPMDLPGLPWVEQCHCGSGKVPHRFGKHESCESYKHHCDTCHGSRSCTLHECIAAFNPGEPARRDTIDQVATWLDLEAANLHAVAVGMTAERAGLRRATAAVLAGFAAKLRNGSWLRDLAALDSPAPDAGQATKERL